MTILAIEAATPQDRWEFAFLLIAAVLFFGGRELYERRAGVGRHEAGEDPSPTPPREGRRGGSSRSAGEPPHDEPLDEPSFEPPPLRGRVAEVAREQLHRLGLALVDQTQEDEEEEPYEEAEETVEEYAWRMLDGGLSIARTARGISDHWGYSESHAKRIARAVKTASDKHGKNGEDVDE